jgi:tectonin beta-propeller repeat-containing protein 1
MYAVDFPRAYGPAKTWNSMVRRRKWFRYRRYAAVESWAVIDNVTKDPTGEPFIDIAIGGAELPAGSPDELSVWGVTVLGRVSRASHRVTILLTMS